LGAGDIQDKNLAPGKLAKPMEENLIRETWASAQPSFKLQLQKTPVQQRKIKE
jgi:hypothetical protein